MKNVSIIIDFTCESSVSQKKLDNLLSDIEELIGKRNYDLDNAEITVDDDEDND
jgi:hypothetical protein